MTLDDFGVRSHVPPPRVQRQDAIELRGGFRTDVAGNIGPIPQRNTFGFVTTRSRAEGLHAGLSHAAAAYPIYTRAIGRAEAKGAGIVLVAEVDTGDVFEWPIREWRHDVPVRETDGELHDEGQLYAPIETADEWTDHFDGLFISGDVDVTSVTRDDER